MSETLQLTWGLLIIGVGISAAMYGITTAQTFFYYRTYPDDPVSTRILTGVTWILNTIHVALTIHIPWYYLIDGVGGINDAKVVWSWPVSVIVTVLISLPVYAYYVRRMHVLGAPLWLCITILAMAITHFSLAIVWSTKLLVSGQMTVLTLPTTLPAIYAGLAIGTTTDVSIAVIMCWLLMRSRTGHSNTNSVVSWLLIYTINTGMLIALCVVASLISGFVAERTQFVLFFLFILPDMYANSYLGSLNNRQAMRAHLSQAKQTSTERSYALGDLRSPVTSNAVIHVERTTEVRKGDLNFPFDDAEAGYDTRRSKGF